MTCEEFSECYDDVNICLWTNGSSLTQTVAQTACQQRNTFLPRITNSSIQSKLAEFRNASDNLLKGWGFWIDVKAVGINNWHWIDGSPLAGLCLHEYFDMRVDREWCMGSGSFLPTGQWSEMMLQCSMSPFF